MPRFPAVADRFYPGSPDDLSRVLAGLFPAKPVTKQKALAVVSPHAGYIYSGAVAAEVLSLVEIPETVILLGPNHHGKGGPVAVSTTTWQMPMGDVPIDEEIAARLQASLAVIKGDETAHRFEHSLEVQIPFLQAMQKNLHIVPIVVSHLSYALCLEIAETIAEVISTSGKEILVVASSDMSHYESRRSATKKDRMALDRIENLDAEGLYRTVTEHRITMCGIIPVTIALLAAVRLGAREARVQTYTDSGAISGDTDQVVGYAGIVIR